MFSLDIDKSACNSVVMFVDKMFEAKEPIQMVLIAM